MGKEIRMMLLSEKSGKSYTVKMHLVSLIAIIIGCLLFISLSFVLAFRYMETYKQSRANKQQVNALSERLESLKKENREALLYNKWADDIIFRRYNYTDKTGREAPAVADSPRGGEALESSERTLHSTVDIDDFDIKRLNLEMDFEVSFKLINRTKNHKKISGYIYIIASNSDVKPEIYASWPQGKLVSGMPEDYTKGIDFAIRYMRYVRGRIVQPSIGPKFNRIDIIAYSEEGSIIMKKGYYIERLLQHNSYE